MSQPVVNKHQNDDFDDTVDSELSLVVSEICTMENSGTIIRNFYVKCMLCLF